MASGKTTLGKALAADLGVPFVDLDDYLEQQAGITPAEWFATRGEVDFRQAEQQALRDIAALYPVGVIATGGGTPCRPEAMQFMLNTGTVVWLEASPERTIARLLDAPGQRPIIDKIPSECLAQFISDHASARRPFYSQAHYYFDSSLLDNADEIVDTLVRFKQLIK